MNPNRRLALVACAASLLAGCATTPPKPGLAEVGIYSAGQGSAFLPYAQGVANHLTGNGLKAQALESSGSIVKQVADAADAVVFGLNDIELAAMRKRFPFLSPTTVAPNTYRGQAAAINSVAAWNFVMAHKDLPEADAYWITRTVLGAADPRTAIHASAGPTRAVNAANNTVVPFHPGALKFYREYGVQGLR